MTTLEEFLALPDVGTETEEVKLPRFSVKVKPMTHKQFGSYQQRAKIRGKKGLEYDTSKLNILIVSGQTVEPNLASAEFLAKANCQTASEFIERKFKAGEIAELANRITAISGFDIDFEEMVEEAKN